MSCNFFHLLLKTDFENIFENFDSVGDHLSLTINNTINNFSQNSKNELYSCLCHKLIFLVIFLSFLFFSQDYELLASEIKTLIHLVLGFPNLPQNVAFVLGIAKERLSCVQFSNSIKRTARHQETMVSDTF